MKKIFVRIDDITPRMDWSRFYLVLDLLKKYNIKPLLGVVPDNQDPFLNVGDNELYFFDIIKKLQDEGYIIALHGYQHCYDTPCKGLFHWRKLSEFAGHTYEIQDEKIRSGIEIFKKHNLKTDIFMAPGHTFDDTTIEVLKKYNFEYITDGWASKPFIYHNMKFVPCRQRFKFHGMKTHTLCLHPNFETEEAIKRRIPDFLEKNKKYLVSYEKYRELNYNNKFWKISVLKYRFTLKTINLIKKIIRRK